MHGGDGSKSTGDKTLCSCIRGSKPITDIFATPCIVCTNSYISSHGRGVGDYRFKVHNLCAESMLGMRYPKADKPIGCALCR